MSRAVAAPAAEPHEAPSLSWEAVVGGLGLLVLGLVGAGAALGWRVANLHNGLLALSFTGVGLYVVRARPRHRVGLLFLGLGVVSAFVYFGRQYGWAAGPLPGGRWLAWVSIWLVPLVMAGCGLALTVFSTGRHTGPRWRTASHVVWVLAAVLAVASALWPIEDDWSTGGLAFPFSVGGAETARAVFGPLMLFCYSAFPVLWAAAVITRVRRAGDEEARQLRWFLFALGVAVLLQFVGTSVWRTPLLGLLAYPLVPVAAGLTIVRYRLYDLEPLNRTLVAAALLGLVSVVHGALVAGLGALVPVSDRTLALAVTALVAIAFEPARRRAQRLVDRLVHGRRATPYEALSGLSVQLARADEDLLVGLAVTVAAGLRAGSVAIWVGTAERMELAARWPTSATGQHAPRALAEVAGPGELARPVLHRGRVRGALVLRHPRGDRLRPSETRLLDDLLAQTGLVVDHRDRLEEVGRQAAELRAAARRIVSAEDAARRRIERDLHDGAQRRLVVLGMELGALAERASAVGDAGLVEQAVRARRHLLEATAELRAMARGVHPSVLTEEGLEAALAHLGDHSPVPVGLHLHLGRRLPPEVEATAYFVVNEAITNRARHARAGSVDVTARYDGGRLTLAVSDDGVGGADAGAGTGLQGLADRLAVLGARLDVTSPPGGGTTLRTVIECA